MYIKRLIAFFLPQLIAFGNISAQSGWHSLDLGQEIPNIQLTLLSDSKALRINDLKGKLVILDFWGIHCSTCITSMPELQRIQDMHPNEVQVILVTKDSKSDVLNFQKRSNIFRRIHLPIIADDSIFCKLFPHIAEPYDIWINKDGIVSEMTSFLGTNLANVTKFLEGKSLNIPVVKEIIDFNTNYPIFLNEAGRIKDYVESYSVLLRQIPGLTRGGSRVRTDSITHKICGALLLNQTILQMFRFAFRDSITGESFPTNRCLLKVENPEYFDYPNQSDDLFRWAAAHQYTYEIIVPPNESKNVFKIMHQDLERNFKVKAAIKIVRVKCFVLIKQRNGPNIRSKGGVPLVSMDNINEEGLSIRNYSLKSSLLKTLNIANQSLKRPVVDETNIDYNIDLNIHCRLTDLKELKSELNRNGLMLVGSERRLPMLVIEKI